MARSGRIEKKSEGAGNGLKKGPWTPEEDQKLLSYVQRFGEGGWASLSSKAGLKRCGKSCRLRWNNYLRPDIKMDDFTLEEERTIIQLHALLGNRWSAIASCLPKRTDSKIKNHWNSHIKKRLAKMGIDPTTHKPKVSHGSNLNHMAQWEAARLEAEARLVQNPKPYPYYQKPHKMANTTTLPYTQCLDVLKVWQGITPNAASSFLKDVPLLIPTMNYAENDNLISQGSTETLMEPYDGLVYPFDASFVNTEPSIGCMDLPISGTENLDQHMNDALLKNSKSVTACFKPVADLLFSSSDGWSGLLTD